MNGLHIVFETSEFVDDAASRAARVNETVGGAALATWLAEEARAAGLPAVTPWVEDHGWDFAIATDAGTYLCVCSVEDDENGAPVREAHVSVSKDRSIWDRLQGRNKVAKDDPVIRSLRDAIVRRAGAGKIDEKWLA
jgi:hypothetical protein